jgi:peptidyl-tRNA hydrolase, PTH2 family
MKQVIVVNSSLKLPPGKMAAQVAHAAVGAFLRAPSSLQKHWLDDGMPKIVLRCDSEAEMFAVLRDAEAAGLPVSLVRDVGRTVTNPGTATCIGIGPDSADKIDVITGKLALAP